MTYNIQAQCIQYVPPAVSKLYSLHPVAVELHEQTDIFQRVFPKTFYLSRMPFLIESEAECIGFHLFNFTFKKKTSVWSECGAQLALFAARLVGQGANITTPPGRQVCQLFGKSIMHE